LIGTEAPGASGPRTRTVLALLLLAAAALNLAAARRAPGVSPDSCGYLSAAENLAAGRGFVGSMTRWGETSDFHSGSASPPLFPAALAALRLAGLPVDAAARLVEAVAFALVVLGTAFLAGLLEARAAKGESRPARAWVGPLGGALALASWPLLRVSTWILADAPFHALSVFAVHAFLRSGDEDASPAAASRRLALASVLCALAVLTRYAGVILWWILVLGCLGLGGARPRVPRSRALGAMACALVPLLAWFLRNALVTGSVLYGEREVLLAGGPGLFADALRGALSDLVPVPLPVLPALPSLPVSPAALVGLAAAAALALLLLSGRVPLDAIRRRFRGARGAGLLLWAWGLTVLGIPVAATAFRATVERRYLAAALPFLIAAATAVVVPPAFATGPVPRPFRAAVLLLLAGSLTAGPVNALAARPVGSLAAPALLDRPSAAFLRDLDAPRFCTDSSAALWYVVRRPVRALPPADRPDQVRLLAEGGFEGALVVRRSAEAGASRQATLGQLLDAGLLRRWERVASFPECEVFLRRR